MLSVIPGNKPISLYFYSSNLNIQPSIAKPISGAKVPVMIGLAMRSGCRKCERKVSKMTREFSVVIEKDEDGYFVAWVPALRGCHTQARSLDVLMRRIKEAIELCLEVEEPVTSEFIGVQRVAVTA